jgi:hypothetical protein
MVGEQLQHRAGAVNHREEVIAEFLRRRSKRAASVPCERQTDSSWAYNNEVLWAHAEGPPNSLISGQQAATFRKAFRHGAGSYRDSVRYRYDRTYERRMSRMIGSMQDSIFRAILKAPFPQPRSSS